MRRVARLPAQRNSLRCRAGAPSAACGNRHATKQSRWRNFALAPRHSQLYIAVPGPVHLKLN